MKVRNGRIFSKVNFDHALEEEINEYFNYGVSKNVLPVWRMEQCCYEVIHVPVGWIHSVTNVAPNWKYAFDYTSMHQYARNAVAGRLNAKLFGGTGVLEDYRAAFPTLVDVFIDYHNLARLRVRFTCHEKCKPYVTCLVCTALALHHTSPSLHIQTNHASIKHSPQSTRNCVLCVIKCIITRP